MAYTISGVITIATAGTALPGPDTGPGTFFIKPDDAASGAYVYIGNVSADVASTNGLKLPKAHPGIYMTVSSLDQVYFDVTTNGDKLTWLRVEGENQGIKAPAI
jgi:hypothetical protein